MVLSRLPWRERRAAGCGEDQTLRTSRNPETEAEEMCVAQRLLLACATRKATSQASWERENNETFPSLQFPDPRSALVLLNPLPACAKYFGNMFGCRGG